MNIYSDQFMENIKISQFGKQELAVLRQEIQTSLDNIKSKFGLKELTLGNISFNQLSFSGKIQGNVESEVLKEIEKTEEKFFAFRHGLPENLIGCEFMLENDIFTIIKIESKNPEIPNYCRV